jgi:hypothetical protein
MKLSIINGGENEISMAKTLASKMAKMAVNIQ